MKRLLILALLLLPLTGFAKWGDTPVNKIREGRHLNFVYDSDRDIYLAPNDWFKGHGYWIIPKSGEPIYLDKTGRIRDLSLKSQGYLEDIRLEILSDKSSDEVRFRMALDNRYPSKVV